MVLCVGEILLHRHLSAGAALNANAKKPNLWSYCAHRGERPSNDSVFKDLTARFTWQATAKHKFAMTWTEQPQCLCAELISATVAPKPHSSGYSDPQLILDWSLR